MLTNCHFGLSPSLGKIEGPLPHAGLSHAAASPGLPAVTLYNRRLAHYAFGRRQRLPGWRVNGEPCSWRSVQQAKVRSVCLGPDPGRGITVIRERLRKAYRYPCTAADVLHVLRHVEPRLLEGLVLLLLHQPTRKELGRRTVYAWAGRTWRGPHGYGRMISMNAVHEERLDVIRYGKRCDPASLWDVGFFRSLGIRIDEDDGSYLVRFGARGYRDWMIYHVLLHELGHVNQPWDFRGDVEEDAERFAIRLGRDLRANRVIPFEPIEDQGPPMRPRRDRGRLRRSGREKASWTEEAG